MVQVGHKFWHTLYRPTISIISTLNKISRRERKEEKTPSVIAKLFNSFISVTCVNLDRWGENISPPQILSKSIFPGHVRLKNTLRIIT